MRVRRIDYLLLSLLLVLSAALYLARAFVADRSPPRIKITRSTLDKIHHGMSEDEITAILGVPPGDYTTRPIACYIWVGSDNDVLNPPPRTKKDWFFNWCCISVLFEEGTAVRIYTFRGIRQRLWIEEMLGVRIGPLLEPEE